MSSRFREIFDDCQTIRIEFYEDAKEIIDEVLRTLTPPQNQPQHPQQRSTQSPPDKHDHYPTYEKFEINPKKYQEERIANENDDEEIYFDEEIHKGSLPKYGDDAFKDISTETQELEENERKIKSVLDNIKRNSIPRLNPRPEANFFNLDGCRKGGFESFHKNPLVAMYLKPLAKDIIGLEREANWMFLKKRMRRELLNDLQKEYVEIISHPEKAKINGDENINVELFK